MTKIQIGWKAIIKFYREMPVKEVLANIWRGTRHRYCRHSSITAFSNGPFPEGITQLPTQCNNCGKLDV